MNRESVEYFPFATYRGVLFSFVSMSIILLGLICVVTVDGFSSVADIGTSLLLLVMEVFFIGGSWYAISLSRTKVIMTPKGVSIWEKGKKYRFAMWDNLCAAAFWHTRWGSYVILSPTPMEKEEQKRIARMCYKHSRICIEDVFCIPLNWPRKKVLEVRSFLYQYITVMDEGDQ